MRFGQLRQTRHRAVAGLTGQVRRHPALTLVMTAAALVAIAEPATAGTYAPDAFTQTNLIGDTAASNPALVDPNLQNAWGLAAGPTSPIWVADNNSGFATVYSGGINGSPVKLDLTVPVPDGNPSGQVFNGDTTAFPVGGPTGSHAIFIVDSDSIGSNPNAGEISAWNGGASFVVEDSPTGGAAGTTIPGAIFKGLTIATTAPNGPELLAADVSNGRVEAFDSNFVPMHLPGWAFHDPFVPHAFVPFGIQELNNLIYVSYGLQNADHTDVVPGHGLGFVSVFSEDGHLVRHLVNGGFFSPLNEPWGLAIAPAGFGPFAGDLLVGNLGDGRINAFDPNTGRFLGPLRSSSGQPIAIDGLWGLRVGNAAFGGASSVIFSAGPNGYSNGLVGTLNPAG